MFRMPSMKDSSEIWEAFLAREGKIYQYNVIQNFEVFIIELRTWFDKQTEENSMCVFRDILVIVLILLLHS